MTLFTVIDPVGSIPVFLYAVTKVSPELHHRFAIRAVLFAFLIGGQFILNALGLNFGSFKIAGGIILFIFALTMIFGDSKPNSEIAQDKGSELDGAVFLCFDEKTFIRSGC